VWQAVESNANGLTRLANRHETVGNAEYTVASDGGGAGVFVKPDEPRQRLPGIAAYINGKGNAVFDPSTQASFLAARHDARRRTTA
jgi:hypothetical protein